MGWDLALGGLVFAMAVRGYLRGFVLQAIRLMGLVISVFAAGPVRDQARPHVATYLPTIRPDLVDRGLWWASAVASYVVLAGLATLAVKLYRRQPFGLEEANRNDQLAGSMLGLAKGLVAASFLAMAIDSYALGHLKAMPWVQEQARESTALAWHRQYRPATRIWTAPPVQHVVAHIKRMGLNPPGVKSDEPATPPAPLQTASRTPKLQWPAIEAPAVNADGLDPEVAQAVEDVKEALRRGEDRN